MRQDSALNDPLKYFESRKHRPLGGTGRPNKLFFPVALNSLFFELFGKLARPARKLARKFYMELDEQIAALAFGDRHALAAHAQNFIDGYSFRNSHFNWPVERLNRVLGA